MRVLVTGGAGFIGSNLVDVLIARRHEAGVVDDLSSGSAENVHPDAWFSPLDICDPALAETMAGFGPDAVVHLAAQVDVAASVADPVFDERVNVGGSRAVAAAAREAGARLLLFSSSAAVYGPDVPAPTSETAPKAPANPYGEHKLEAERVIAGEFAGQGRDLAVMRFSNVYGPRQVSAGEGGVVAIFAERMLGGATPAIYGDGAQTRDFIYVGDVVAFVLAALGSAGPLAGPQPDGPAYNVSTGLPTTVEDLAGIMRDASGYEGPIDHAQERPGDIRDSTLDPSKAASALGWRAVEPLDAGIRATLAWFARTAGGS
jgi:UDP-glucose 4-epimerase